MQNKKAGRIRNTRFTTYLIAFGLVLSDLASRNPLMLKEGEYAVESKTVVCTKDFDKGLVDFGPGCDQKGVRKYHP